MPPRHPASFYRFIIGFAFIFGLCVIAVVARISFIYGQQQSLQAETCETEELQARIEQLESQIAALIAVPKHSSMLFETNLPGNEEDAVSLAEWRQRLTANPGVMRDFPSGWPISQGYVSSMYGKRKSGSRHEGIDIVTAAGAPIFAVAEGRVVYAERRGAYGKLIDIRHPDGSLTRYAHNQENLVKPGATVTAGQMIARVGATGNASTAHLHFELLRDNRAVDPLAYLLNLASNTALAELALP